MTEQEWLTCTDPQPMLEFLRDKTSDRKLRLFACACCWRISNGSRDKRSREILEIVERYAEGEVDRQTLHDWAWMRARGREVWPATLFESWSAATSSSEVAAGRMPQTSVVDQCFLLRCIFGNPFRPVAFDSAWCTPSVTAIAQAIYEERRFADLPILADALEEAGCTSAELLAHCRSGGEHVRGCWALDLALAKE